MEQWRLHEKPKKELEEIGIPPGLKNTAGGLTQYAEMYEFYQLQATAMELFCELENSTEEIAPRSEFDKSIEGFFDYYTAYYVAYNFSGALSKQGKHFSLMMTDDCALNALRQVTTGFRWGLAMTDNSGKRVSQGHHRMHFGVVDVAQHYHVIADAIIASEDTAMMQTVLSKTKEHVEKRVNALLRFLVTSRWDTPLQDNVTMQLLGAILGFLVTSSSMSQSSWS